MKSLTSSARSPGTPSRVNLRARHRLARAPSSTCPHCQRVTKTVDGVCADCWGQKDIEARVFRRPSRTESFLGLSWDNLDMLTVSLLGFVVATLLALIGLWISG